jgi:hypothetical protein
MHDGTDLNPADAFKPLPIWAQRGIQCMAEGLRRMGMNLEDVAAAVAKSEQHARRILYPCARAENRLPLVSIPRVEQRVRPRNRAAAPRRRARAPSGDDDPSPEPSDPDEPDDVAPDRARSIPTPERRCGMADAARIEYTQCGGQRAWEREVRALSDEDLIRCVRAQVAVERAVSTYRKGAARPISTATKRWTP